jgi:hypothetical protein
LSLEFGLVDLHNGGDARNADMALKETGLAIEGRRLETWGLRKFVQMSSEERMGMFGDVLGNRMVERVSTVLEQSQGVMA